MPEHSSCRKNSDDGYYVRPADGGYTPDLEGKGFIVFDYFWSGNASFGNRGRAVTGASRTPPPAARMRPSVVANGRAGPVVAGEYVCS